MNTLDSYELIDLNYAVEKEYQSIIKGKTPVENHKAFILGGQPGSGKSTLQDMIVTREPNTVAVNGDAYRRWHPNYEEIYTVYGNEAANHTQSFANAAAATLVEKLSNDGYNIVIEGTCRRAEVPLKTCRDLKEKSYDVELMVMCCDKDVAWQSTIDRYVLMSQQGKLPRAVPQDKYNETIKCLPDNINELYRSGEFSEITLYNRERTELYRMTKTPDEAPGFIVYDNLHANSRDIHFGLLGNGITVYDVSRTDPSIHDYPTIAHISAEGKTTMYTSVVSDSDIKKIEKHSEEQRERFKEFWNKKSVESRYSEILDRATISQSLQMSEDKDLDMKMKVAKYENSIIFGTEEFPAAVKEEDVKMGRNENEVTFEDIRKLDYKNITEFEIPAGVTRIGKSAFQDCKNIERVTIPNTVKVIDEYAFYGCESLKSITIPDSVTEICYCAFSDCKRLEEVKIPDSVDYIGPLAFQDCKSLERVIMPEHIEVTDTDVYFLGCSDVEIKTSNSETIIRGDNMAHIYAKDGQVISNFISDMFFEGEYADTNIYVTGENEQECVELLGDLQEKYGELTRYSVVDYDEVLFFNEAVNKNERRYVNSYENPEYREHWGLNDEPDEPEPPEPEDYPDLTGLDKLNR